MDVEITAPPTDGITCVRYCPNSKKSLLLVSSWDSFLRLYDGANLHTQIELETALLSCCFGATDSEAFTGGLDGTLYRVDLSTRGRKSIGSHKGTIRHVHYTNDYHLLCTGGWDSMIQFYDVRNKDAFVSSTKCDGKVFGMDVRSHLAVVATSERKVSVYDLRQSKQPVETYESLLKYQTRCISIFPSLDGYVIGSIEGRVALDFFSDRQKEDSDEQKEETKATKKLSYAFKCHRTKIDQDQVLVYPVNAIAFHPVHETFATGGCDGVVNVWDGQSKKRIHQLSSYPTRYEHLHCVRFFIHVTVIVLRLWISIRTVRCWRLHLRTRMKKEKKSTFPSSPQQYCH